MKTLENLAFDNKMVAKSIEKLLASNYGEDEIIDKLEEVVDYLNDTAYNLEWFNDQLEITIQKLVDLP
mgnify:CR=1 FL=1